MSGNPPSMLADSARAGALCRQVLRPNEGRLVRGHLALRDASARSPCLCSTQRVPWAHRCPLEIDGPGR